MRMNRPDSQLLLAGAMLAAFLTTACPGNRTAADPMRDEARNGEAFADIIDSQGHRVGRATFAEIPEGVLVRVEVSNLPPGERGIHIHEVGRCDPPGFETAGDHFNPDGRQHGTLNPEGPHKGDLMNLVIRPDGTGLHVSIAERANLRTGEQSLLRDGGTAIIIHEERDDLRTDPTGGAGGRIACGVITR